VAFENAPDTLTMPAETNPFLLVVILAIAALGFAVGPLVAAYVWAKIFSPRKPGHEKQATYECGLEGKGDAWIQFRSEYYLYAIIFLVFDVETIFLLPFAVAFTGLGVGAFISLMTFLFLLAVSLVWAWKKGILVWK
jgi:NADH-quinone oxidoreductase subunit A